jgi:hypothetical protein
MLPFVNRRFHFVFIREWQVSRLIKILFAFTAPCPDPDTNEDGEYQYRKK